MYTTLIRSLFAALILALLAGHSPASAAAPQWKSYQPTAEETSITTDGVSVLTVAYTFPNSGYRVQWPGTVTVKGSEIIVDTDVEQTTGMSLQVITTFEQSFDLTTLQPGTYTVTVRANKKSVQKSSVTVAQ